MFASDRDLVSFEPDLFRDVGWAGQTLIRATGDIGGGGAGVLTISAYDADLAQAGVGEGFVALVDGVPCEIIERLSDTTALVSRIRANPDDDPIPPPPVSGKTTFIATFRPQIALVHRQVLRLLGVGGVSGEDAPAEADIVNPDDFRNLEAVGALHVILSAAAALAGADSPLVRRARFYRESFGALRQVTAARIDTDGDGLADAVRRLNVLHLERV